MGLLPNSTAGKIQFCESHLADWSANAVAIGSSAPEIAALTTKTESARAALTEQETAQETAKTKTAALRDAVDEMVLATSDLIKKVRAKAATAGNSVYQLANIPAPAVPSPVGAPGQPSNFKVSLGVDGAPAISWKCNNPAGCIGVIYQLWRRTTADGEFAYIGGTGARKFVDGTIPAGTSQVTYQMQAVRSTAAGPWAQFNVNFGTAGGTGAGAGAGAAVVETAVRRGA